MGKHTQIFDGLSSSEVQQVLEHGVLHEYDKDELLFKKGSRSNTMFLVVEGQVRIYIDFHGIEVDLTKLGKGDVFGEIAAITRSPRTANAVVQKKSTLFQFDDDVLGRLNGNHPKIATQLYFNLLKIVSQRLADTNRKLVSERVERLESSLLYARMPQFEGPAGAMQYDVAGAGDPVVLLAGLGFDGAAWGYQVPALKGDVQVITLDNRGCGGSVAPDGDYALEDMAGDVVALLDHLEIDRAAVAGMSLGGMIAQVLAADHPDRVSRLGLVATTAAPDAFALAVLDALEGVAVDEGLDQAYDHLLLWCYTPRFYREQGELLAALRETLAQRLPPEQGFLGQLAAVRSCHTLDRLPKIQAPTLVLWPAEDRLFDRSHSETLAEAIPDARLQDLPGGHGCLVEEAEALNVALADFLLEE